MHRRYGASINSVYVQLNTTTTMVKFKDPDIMSACAEKIIDRLYELALCDTRIMVCDWLAYATLATYRLVNELTGESDLPTMDECFDGTAVTPELSDNPK